MPRAARRVACGLALTAVAAGAAGCGGDATGEQSYDTKVAVYLGVPLRGPWGPRGIAIGRGAELGLADAGGGAGTFSVRLTERDVTDEDGKGVGAEGAAREAGTALRDLGTIGVIGGLDPTSSRELLLLANQTGAGYVSASGDQIDASAEDLAPRGRRMSVQLAAPDSALAAALRGRVAAADCRRTVLVDVPDAGVGASRDSDDLRPAKTLRAASYGDRSLQEDFARALGGGTDCVVIDGNPSGGDPVALLEPVVDRLKGKTLLLTRGAASQAAADLARAHGLRAEAIVDDPVPGASAEGRRIDALYRKVYGTPAPIGAIPGWRAIKLQVKAVADAGAGGSRRDAVSKALVAAPVPGPPGVGRQRDDGSVTNTSVSLARPEAYGWRAFRALDGR